MIQVVRHAEASRPAVRGVTSRRAGAAKSIGEVFAPMNRTRLTRLAGRVLCLRRLNVGFRSAKAGPFAERKATNQTASPGRFRFVLAVCVTLLSHLLALSGPARAQLPRPAPHDGYWLCFSSFYEGDFKTAAGGFREAAKDGIFNLGAVGGPWIDAICYHAMLGECAYQMGDLPDALTEYNAAIKVFIAHRDWMLRIDFPPGIEPELNVKNVPTWGKSARGGTLGHFAPQYPSLAGQLNNNAAILRGGVVAPPSFHPVYASEIVRSTALAISRRRELMGPVCEHDPLTLQLVEALARRPGQPNHWSQCWVELELGLAFAAANRIPQAVSELQKSILAAGRFDHPLTCVALLELGKLAFEQGKYDAAATYFYEATISGAWFDRYEVLEEAFRRGTESHLLAGGKGVYGPLAPAAAAYYKSRWLHASLLTSLAEQLLEAGNLPSSATAAAQARSAITRREMWAGAAGSRLNFLAARAALRSGDLKAGGTALAAALTYQKAACRRQFQIGLVDVAFRGGSLTERLVDQLFTEVLREPTRVDWSTDTLDTLAALTSPHPLPYEHWFEVVLARRDSERALEIADALRRHRFYATQPLGGRLLALRWVLEGPADALSAAVLLQRQELLTRFPQFGELSQRSAELRRKLQDLPLTGGDEAQVRRQQECFLELGKVVTAQESLLQRMAVERVPAELAFPPRLEARQLREQLPDGTLARVYLATSRNVHAFALAKDRYAHFVVSQPAKAKADVADFLRACGQHDRVQPVPLEDLKSKAWQTAAERVASSLFGETKAEEWAKYREVVIVPDGVLWYVPFEALPIPTSGGTSPLIMQMPVRYVPTLSLAVSRHRAIRPLERTAIVAGKLLPRDDDTAVKQAISSIASVAGDSLTLRKEPPTSSALYAAALDRLVVMAESEDAPQPLAWSPMLFDAGKPGGTLADWLQLPLSGIDQVVLPGFHTPAEYALKRGGSGEEMFLTICDLMASGCRTVLISRWRVGGQSTVDNVREFLQELPHEAAADAWRRSVLLGIERPLDPPAEGRVKPSPTVDGAKTDHPFFWAGYLLVDTGARPESESPAPNQQPLPNLVPAVRQQ